MTIGEKIGALRRKRNLSQEQLAEVLGVSRQAVSKWESEQAVPELGKLPKLAALFDVSIDYLVDDTREVDERAQKAAKRRQGDIAFWLAFGMGLVVIGLVVAVFGWYMHQTLTPVATGLCVQVLGVVFFEGFGAAGASVGEKLVLRRRFYRVTLWLLLLVLVYLAVQLVFGMLPFAYSAVCPYWVALALYGLTGWAVYHRVIKR